MHLFFIDTQHSSHVVYVIPNLLVDTLRAIYTEACRSDASLFLRCRIQIDERSHAPVSTWPYLIQHLAFALEHDRQASHWQDAAPFIRYHRMVHANALQQLGVSNTVLNALQPPTAPPLSIRIQYIQHDGNHAEIISTSHQLLADIQGIYHHHCQQNTDLFLRTRIAMGLHSTTWKPISQAIVDKLHQGGNVTPWRTLMYFLLDADALTLDHLKAHGLRAEVIKTLALMPVSPPKQSLECNSLTATINHHAHGMFADSMLSAESTQHTSEAERLNSHTPDSMHAQKTTQRTSMPGSAAKKLSF